MIMFIFERERRRNKRRKGEGKKMRSIKIDEIRRVRLMN